MGDARKHNTLFFEHNPTDPRVELLLTSWGQGVEVLTESTRGLHRGKLKLLKWTKKSRRYFKMCPLHEVHDQQA